MAALPVKVGPTGVRIRRLEGLLAILVTFLAACGGGDDDQGRGGLASTCRAQVGVATGLVAMITSVPGLSPYGEPSEETRAQVRSAYDANVAAPLAALVANAPADIADPVRQVATAATEVRSTGDPAVLEDDGFIRNTDLVDGYLHENCAGTKATVEAVDYAYRDLPRTLPAGAVRLALRNTAKEAHSLLVFARQPGVTESYDELLALPGDQRQSRLELVDLTLTDPGQTGFLVADLAAGDYIVICTIGKGTTDYGDPTGGEPHFTLGMRQEVKVT